MNSVFIQILIGLATLLVGDLIGLINIKGIRLGGAGVLLSALLAGVLGFSFPKVIQTYSLIAFVTSIGLLAGPSFIKSFKNNGWAYIITGFVMVLSSSLVAIIIKFIFKLPTSLTLGILAGSLTSAPGLASALSHTNDPILASAGYGLAYPFGVIGVVLFVQIIPIILGYKKDKSATNSKKIKFNKPTLTFKSLISFILVYVLSIISSKITIFGFKLGNSLGPLIVGIAAGIIFSKPSFSEYASVDSKSLSTLRVIGLSLFLLVAGSNAGLVLVKTVATYSPWIFAYGAIMVIVPLIIGYLFAKFIFKLPLFSSLGTICGGMTQTPSVGALLSISNDPSISPSYASTYPIAMITTIFIIGLFTMIL